MKIMVKNKISIIYKSLIVLCVIVGVSLQSGFGSTGFSIGYFRYFTTLSNLAVGLFFAFDVVRLLKSKTGERHFSSYFKFAITMSIMLTGLVAHFMLRGFFGERPVLMQFGLTLVHYVVPIATVFDWIIFDKKGLTTKKMPCFAAIFPIVYVVYAMIYAQFTTAVDKYPYPFLDVDTYGIKGVALNIILLTIAFFVVGYLGVAIDKLIAKIKK